MTVKTQKVTRLNDYSKNLRFPYSEPYLILIVCDENHVAQDTRKQGAPIDLVTYSWAVLYLVNVMCMLIADGLDS